MSGQITGPWGTVAVDGTSLEFVKHLRDQLQYFLDHNYSPNREFTASEVVALNALFDRGDESLAREYLRRKAAYRQAGESKTHEFVIRELGVL